MNSSYYTIKALTALYIIYKYGFSNKDNKINRNNKSNSKFKKKLTVD